MSTCPAVVTSDELMEAEFLYHRKQLSRPQFRAHIDKINALHNLADLNCITIDLVDYYLRRDNGQKVYGIIQPIKQIETSKKAWTLVCFTTKKDALRMHNNSKRISTWKSGSKSKSGFKSKSGSKSKSQRKRSEHQNARSCDPQSGASAKGLLYISHEMTSAIVPERVIQCNQMNPKMIYELMSKGIALMTRNIIHNNTWILTFDFQDHTGALLYCVADRCEQGDGRGYKWKLRDDLYTANQIMALTGLALHELATTIRHSKSFKSKLKRVKIMKAMLNDPQQHADIFHEMRDWPHLPVIINDRDANKTQFKCTKTKYVFTNDCAKSISNAMTYGAVEVIAILLFNHITGGIDIDAGLRLCIEGCDMVITFRYVHSKRTAPYLLPTAILLDVERVELLHYLVEGGASKITTFFDSWKSLFNDFAIGNRKDDENKYKAKSKDCARYKQSDHALKVLIHDLKPVMNDHPTVAHAVRRAETASGIAHVDQEEETKYDAVLHVAKWQANRPNLLHRSEMVPPIAPMSLSYSIPPPMPLFYPMPLIGNVQCFSLPPLLSYTILYYPPMITWPMTSPAIAMGNPPMINAQATAPIPTQNTLKPRYDLN
eukprot:168515_1